MKNVLHNLFDCMQILSKNFCPDIQKRTEFLSTEKRDPCWQQYNCQKQGNVCSASWLRFSFMPVPSYSDHTTLFWCLELEKSKEQTAANAGMTLLLMFPWTGSDLSSKWHPVLHFVKLLPVFLSCKPGVSLLHILISAVCNFLAFIKIVGIL